MKKNHVEIMDVTLRDGSYAINFQYSINDEWNICTALENLGYRFIEIGHGMGIGASNEKNGCALHSDMEYLECARNCLSKAHYGVFCIPEVATLEDIALAADYGCSFIRVGTNVEDVRKSEKYIKYAKQKNLMVMANYMKSYAASINEFKNAVQYSESWGADLVYIVDSAGSMMPPDIERYYEAIKQCSNIKIGFHGHDNIGMALANSLFAVQLGIDFIDCSLQGIGRSAGNTSLEYLTICLKKMGFDMSVDVEELLMVSRKYVYPLINKTGINPIDAQCGISGFHSSYLKEIHKCSAIYGINPLKLIACYCEQDQVGMDIKLLNKIAASMPKDEKNNDTADFMYYFGTEQMR